MIFSPIIYRDKKHSVIDNETEKNIYLHIMQINAYLFVNLELPMPILLHFQGKAVLLCEVIFYIYKTSTC